jgi:hypothetical protein
MTLLVIFVLLFSLQGFSQTAEKSLHPLLDKYYPRPEPTDTNRAVSTQIKPVSETKPATAVKTIPGLTTTPSLTATPVETTSPADTTTQSVSTVPGMATTPTLTSTTSVNKPTTVTAVPVQKKVQTQPAPTSSYTDTRLGSSTKSYDTWEKNSNGAGSVTTSPK